MYHIGIDGAGVTSPFWGLRSPKGRPKLGWGDEIQNESIRDDTRLATGLVAQQPSELRTTANISGKFAVRLSWQQEIFLENVGFRQQFVSS